MNSLIELAAPLTHSNQIDQFVLSSHSLESNSIDNLGIEASSTAHSNLQPFGNELEMSKFNENERMKRKTEEVLSMNEEGGKKIKYDQGSNFDDVFGALNNGTISSKNESDSLSFPPTINFSYSLPNYSNSNHPLYILPSNQTHLPIDPVLLSTFQPFDINQIIFNPPIWTSIQTTLLRTIINQTKKLKSLKLNWKKIQSDLIFKNEMFEMEEKSIIDCIIHWRRLSLDVQLGGKISSEPLIGSLWTYQHKLKLQSIVRQTLENVPTIDKLDWNEIAQDFNSGLNGSICEELWENGVGDEDVIVEELETQPSADSLDFTPFLLPRNYLPARFIYSPKSLTIDGKIQRKRMIPLNRKETKVEKERIQNLNYEGIESFCSQEARSWKGMDWEWEVVKLWNIMANGGRYDEAVGGFIL